MAGAAWRAAVESSQKLSAFPTSRPLPDFVRDFHFTNSPKRGPDVTRPPGAGGMSPGRYRTGRLVAKACVGFADEFHLSRRVRRRSRNALALRRTPRSPP